VSVHNTALFNVVEAIVIGQARPARCSVKSVIIGLESPIYLAPIFPNFDIQAFNFANDFIERQGDGVIDVFLRELLPHYLKQIFQG
jgi:hypothetical protein